MGKIEKRTRDMFRRVKSGRISIYTFAEEMFEIGDKLIKNQKGANCFYRAVNDVRYGR